MSLHTLGDSVLLKIFTYVDPKPRLYMNVAATCRRLHQLCTSDLFWARFNVHEVENIYRHFLSQSASFSEMEKKLYIEKARNWYNVIWDLTLDFTELDPYTQLMIILDSRMYCDYEGKVRNRKVMQLGIGMPGNLLFYGCAKLQHDSELVWQSLASRQHKCFRRCPWECELKLAYTLSYSNIDSEFKPPYSSTLYSCCAYRPLEKPWHVGSLLSVRGLSEVEVWRIKLLIRPPQFWDDIERPVFVRYKGQDLPLDGALLKRLETDEALQEAAIWSGVGYFDVPVTNKSFHLKLDAQQRSRFIPVHYNKYDFDEVSRDYSLGPSFDRAVHLVEQNHDLYRVLRCKFKGQQKVELKRARASAKKLWRRTRRPEGVLERLREWYLLPPLHRPIVPTSRSKVPDRVDLVSLKDVYPRFSGFPHGQRFDSLHW